MGGDIGTAQRKRPLRPGTAGEPDLAAQFEQLKPQLFEELSAMLRGKADPHELLGMAAPSTAVPGSLPKDLPGVISPAGAAGLGLAKGVAPKLATAGTQAASGALTRAGTSAVPALTSAIPNMTSAVAAPAVSGVSGAAGGALSGAIPYVGPIVGAAAQLGSQAAQGQPITGEDVGSATGGAVGGGAGAGIGAGVGAAVGTVVPGIGNAIGAALGALIGGAAGGTAGSYGGGAIGRATGGGKARIEAASGPSPFGARYTPGAQPFQQGV